MKIAFIKKIDFKFTNLMHSAVVSISGTTEDMYIHIQLINSFLVKVFGIEHIRFRTEKGKIIMQDAKYPCINQVAQLITMLLKKELDELNPALRAV
jgi:hypothetical protein